MKTSIQFIATIITISFLSACGGSSDDSDVKTGQFKDSAVKGLTYETATQSGTTDEKGTFKYKAGEEVIFKIGAMEIGRAKGADILYPTHITDDKEKAIKVAQVLQTLDKDNNPEGGIDIKGQFKVEFTQNEDIQAIYDLQAMVNKIRTASESLSLVSADQAEKHMNTTIFSDATFESLSNQDDIDNRIGIDNGRLKLSPQTSENVWLLAKSATNDVTEITSLSADVEYLPNSEIANLGLVLELNSINSGVERFRIDIGYSAPQCVFQTEACINIVSDVIMISSLRTRRSHYERYTKDTLNKYNYLYRGAGRDASANYIPPLLSDLFRVNFTIALDKAAKKVIVKHGDKQGYFDISSLFSDFSQLQAKFFIKTQDLSDSDKSVFVDNVKINNQDFDDFSTPTLDTTKWKTGKFSYSGIFSDVHPTFESVSNQNGIDSRIGIDNGRLKFSPQSSESVWLLAKSSTNDVTEVTSLSADVEFNPGQYSYLGLVLELKDTDKVHYFRIVIMHTGSECPPDSQVCAAVFVQRVAVNSLYLGELSAEHTFLGIRSDDKPSYTKDTLAKDKNLYFYSNTAPTETFTANFTIKFDKDTKKVFVKHSGELGSFDVSDLFSDFNQVQSKFFINMHNRAFSGNNKAAFVDNVKINNQDFDDFSTPTLDTTKWKTGKFSYSGK